MSACGRSSGASFAAGARIRRGGEYDRWDADVEVGLLVHRRLLISVEEHGGGAQLIRVRALLRGKLPLALGAVAGALALFSALDHAYLAAALLSCLWIVFLMWFLSEASVTAGVVAEAVESGIEMATPLARPPRSAPRRPKPARERRDELPASQRDAPTGNGRCRQ